MVPLTALFDVVIVGAGPAGLFLAVCLARWDYKIKQIDKREAPTATGRADGIPPRSLHILRNMGLKGEIMKYNPAKVYEMKCTIHSDHASIVILPRENNLVRLYVQLASSADKDFGSRKTTTKAEVKASAKMILNRIISNGIIWKAGLADRSVLSTYESERKLIAENLLDFDAKYAALFSQRTPTASEVSGASEEDGHGEENEFIKTFKANQEFTLGYGILYPANEFNWSRIIALPLISSLEKEASFDRVIFYAAYERPDRSMVPYHEHDNPYSHFFTICTIFAASRDDTEISTLVPALLARYSDHIYADDAWDHRVPEAQASAHAKMDLDANPEGVVIVRPDGHVGCAVRLVEGSGTADALNEYFGAFVTKKIG
ncbi:MAG: hypothetical protein Q9225_005814 [Loekoesia sp. 1 TL-2023]